MSFVPSLVIFCFLSLAARSVRTVRSDLDLDLNSTSSQSQGIVIYGIYYGAETARAGDVDTSNWDHTPKWKKLPVGCEYELNTGFCEVTLLQSACVARHGKRSGITPADACQKVFFGEMKKEPRHMYCMAAAADPKISEFAESLKNLVPDDPSKCHVDQMSHFKTGPPQSTGITFGWTNERLLQRIKEAGNQKQPIFGDDVNKKLSYGIRKLCDPKKLLTDVSSPTASQMENTGFCHKRDQKRQDCDFFWGIRSGWNQKYGQKYCESLQKEPAKLRCLALRKQIIRVAQAKSYFGTVRWTKFDDAFRISRDSCPEPPSGAPDEPKVEDRIGEN